MITTVLVFGTYDKFHPGHEYFLTQAKSYGDRLVVVIARDHNVAKLKRNSPTNSENKRLQVIKQFSAVDEAMLGLEDFSKKESIIDIIAPDVICLGYDQAPNFQSPNSNIKIVRIDAFYPEKYKSSLL
ncbi:MAG: adenylyltransferase/cytidyltransferase family protein [bacterium]|nr:adenylyltransferase/cytidyltransferase family protein [bacterium]